MRAKHLLAMISAMALIASCSEYNMEEKPVNSVVDETVDGIPVASNDPAAVTMTEIDKIAAEMFGFNRSRSSASQSYTIEEIRDEAGNPSIYVLNRPNNAGFVLVSATKDYYPVLAYSDSGNFDASGYGEIGGLKEWKDCMVENISGSAFQPTDTISKYRSMWHRYEDNQYDFNSGKQSRSLPDSEVARLKKIMMDSIASWKSVDRIYEITYNIFGDGHEKEYEEAMELIQGVITPSYMEHWEELSIWVQRTTRTQVKVDNFVNSIWDQEFGYNECFPLLDNGKRAYAGCGPVAAGQVMRYFEHPSTLKWAEMPLNYPTTTTSQLLRNIADKSKSSYGENGTGTFLYNLDDALISYGYSLRYYKGTLGQSTIQDNCVAKKPIITCGYEKNNGDGHTWVISGINYITEYNRYELWTFMVPEQFGHFPNDYLPKKINTYYQYMNWGWGGIQNGFYLTPLEYTESREWIYNITPIK